MPLPAEEPKPGVPDWIVTYGDMMSLLLTFFVLLAAFSELKSGDEGEKVVESILRQFADERTIEVWNAASLLNREMDRAGSTLDPASRDGQNQQRAQTGAEGPPGEQGRVETIRAGDRSIIGGPALFEPGSNVLNAEAKAALRQVGLEYFNRRSFVEVRASFVPGPLPAGSQFNDALELGHARAAAVADFLASDVGLPRDLVRTSVAAPIETKTLARAIGDLGEIVQIAPLESTHRQSSRSGVPIGTKD